ncbi:N-acetylmuramoyl-L-alanine amidase [bacterium]|nr:N-acetylmuramoyl-L-alanine amidase [bacterium]
MQIDKLYCRIVFCLAAVAMAFVCLQSTVARELTGRSDFQTIQFQTKIFEDGEYVSAADLTSYFPDRWSYDGISGTLIFYRPDGVRIGTRLDDQRVMVGTRIVHTGVTPLRQNNIIYIPFYVVDVILFPEVAFAEGGAAAPTPAPFGQSDTGYEYTAGPTPTIPPFQYFPAQPTPTVDYYSGALPMNRVSGAMIVLDPGNDSEQPGASAMFSQHEEGLTLAVCEKMESLLNEDGRFEVTLTRRGAGGVTNEQRIAAANRAQGSLFVSIQCGKLHSTNVSQAVAYYMNPELDVTPQFDPNVVFSPGLQTWHDAYKRHVVSSRRLAGALLQELSSLYRTTNLIKVEADPRPGRMAALRGLTMPGVVLELGNLNHAASARYLSSDAIQTSIAAYLTSAIQNVLLEQPVSNVGG